MLTNDQLGEWEAIANKATPGPWTYDQPVYDFNLSNGESAQVRSDYLQIESPTLPIAQMFLDSNNNAEFAIMARTALPLLIAEVRRLQVDLAAMDKLMDRVESMMNAEDGED